MIAVLILAYGAGVAGAVGLPLEISGASDADRDCAGATVSRASRRF